LIEHRVPPVADDQPERFIEGGPAITKEPRRFRERANDIERSDGGRRLLDRRQFQQRLLAQGLEKLVLQMPRLLIRAKNLRFHLL
jgi:hypothetical protein